MRRHPWPAPAVAALGCAAALSTLTACSSSTGELEKKASGLSSVTAVAATTLDEGDDALPFLDEGSTLVEVTMSADAESDDVLAVFGAYSDEIEDEDIDAVAVVLDTPSAPRLATGPGTKPNRAMVDALLQARNDPDTAQFMLMAVPTVPEIESTLKDAPFGTVVARAEAYAEVEGVDLVEVATGKLSLTLDGENDDDALVRNRATLVTEIDRDFELLEAHVSGQGDLELVVAPGSLQAVKVFLDIELDNRYGTVTVRT
jgi:hypothetical protein